MNRIDSRRWARLAFAGLMVCPLVAHADVGTAAQFARLSFLYLIPLGLIQVIVATRIRSHLPRSRTGMTALLALAAVIAGIALAGSDWEAHAIRGPLAALAYLPALPVAIDLVRQKNWGLALLAVVLPAAAGAFIILDAATP